MGMPPIDHITEEVPLQAGERLRFVKTKAREVGLPLLIQAADAAAVRNQWRTLQRTFDPTRGDGHLQVTGPDGATRELICRYRSGLEGAEGTNDAGLQWQEFTIFLRAHDPYFYASLPITQVFTQASATPFFPFFPLHLGSSQVLADVAVTNPGDVEAWPIWVINGPATQIVLRKLASGSVAEQSLTLNTTLLSTDTVTIDTRPGQKTVLGPASANLYGSLAAGSRLWALPTGTSTIRVELSGATGASKVTLTAAPRYLGV